MTPDPLDDLIRDAFPALDPDEADLERIRDRYQSLIHRQKSGPMFRVASVAAVLVVAIAASVFVVQRPAPAQAALGAVASAAATQAPLEVPVGSVILSIEASVRVDVGTQDIPVLTRTSELREVWRDPDGTGRVLIRTSSPVRIDPSELSRAGTTPPRIGPISSRPVEHLLESSILDANWPTDPSSLEATLRELGSELEALQAARNILIEPLATKDLRSAVLTVLGRFHPRLVSDSGSLVVLEWIVSAPERIAIRLALTRKGEVRTEEWVLQDGVSEAGIPSGAVIRLVTYEAPRIVPSP